jgi:hypothetical protein
LFNPKTPDLIIVSFLVGGLSTIVGDIVIIWRDK